jgi:predicted MFS family arabinose efflux permease
VIGLGGVVIAHQGGWDEILLVVAPMVVIAGLLWIAKRRVDRAAASRAAETAPDEHLPR